MIVQDDFVKSICREFGSVEDRITQLKKHVYE